MKKFSVFLPILLSLNLNGQSVQNRNWEYSKVVYTASSKEKIIITNSLPKGGGIVSYKGNEYNYFIFWTNVRNEATSPLDLKIKFPTIISFKSEESYAKVAFTKSNMTIDKVQEFDYGLKGITTLLNNESNQLKDLNNRISPFNNYLFYSAIFIHKTKWPVRAEYILKDKTLFYKITAGTDVVTVPCGSLDFKN
ncbi:hypothetical protein [Aquirufa rosea]|uniref:Uncharacterized protein n=1 Tax=Aquirufa rosea TaxID=2509241 RepID=A0A4Q1BZ77_9BACT|nr:hypothetical protein [Aquirufa rosea]RXK48844.1 hypothetical protein ESB04_07780 [Aquirufa rosea]